MTLHELKQFINNLPDNLKDCEVQIGLGTEIGATDGFQKFSVSTVKSFDDEGKITETVILDIVAPRDVKRLENALGSGLIEGLFGFDD